MRRWLARFLCVVVISVQATVTLAAIQEFEKPEAKQTNAQDAQLYMQEQVNMPVTLDVASKTTTDLVSEHSFSPDNTDDHWIILDQIKRGHLDFTMAHEQMMSDEFMSEEFQMLIGHMNETGISAGVSAVALTVVYRCRNGRHFVAFWTEFGMNWPVDSVVELGGARETDQTMASRKTMDR